MWRVFVSLLVLAMTIGHPTAAPAQTEVGSVLLIMDASGSMNRVDSSGTRLIDGAKDALREIVLRLPPDANVGLRVYGHRTPNDDPVAGCADTELVVPVGPIDREVLNAAIDSFDASGFTPIGLSLQEAANDLPGSGARTIILVSDGIDTCAPPEPCAVAEQLATEGFVTQIHTVGFFLDDRAAADQLQCIADAGNGTFTSVDSIGQFFEQLYGLVTEALEGPANPGLLVRGALSRELAPVVEWIDFDPNWPGLSTIGDVGTIQAGETLWFAFDVSHDLFPNGQLFVAASIDWQPNAGPDEYLEVEIYNEQEQSIGLPHEVLGIVVEFPQRLYLARATEYIASYSAPQAAVSTAPRGILPAWEPGPEFALTRARFYDAGLNGGLYGLWKGEADPPLPAGRYYAAVTWSSDRVATSRLGIAAVVYQGEGEGWNAGRIVPQGQVFDTDRTTATDDVLALDLVGWDGSTIGGPLGQPLRSIEVWTPLEADSGRTYSIVLAESEILVFNSIGNPGPAEGGRLELELVEDESGLSIERADVDAQYLDVEHDYRAWEAPAGGTYLLTATLRLDAPSDDAAAILSIFVFAADARKLGLPASVFDALMEGLAAVRDAVG